MKYPVALFNIDEVAFAGASQGTTSDNYYLYIGQNDRTLTPSQFNSTIFATVWAASSSLTSSYTVLRPVITLSSSVVITGTGTTSDPYKIQ